MNVSLSEIKELLAKNGTSHSFEVGKNYFIRSVNYHYTGKLVSVTDTDLVLEDAAWIADDGRFTTALKSGAFDEIEPYVNSVIIERGGILDATIWNHPLPREQK